MNPFLKHLYRENDSKHRNGDVDTRLFRDMELQLVD